MRKGEVLELAAIGGLSLLSGAGLGLLMDWLGNASMIPPSTTISEINECAANAGSHEVTEEAIPGVCYGISPEYVPFTSDAYGNIWYHLPSKVELEEDVSSVPSSYASSQAENRVGAEALGMISVPGFFGLTMIIRRQNRPTQPGPPHLTLVKS